MDSESGIGIAPTHQLRTFKNFFVDFNLPATVVRGEQVQVQVTAYNYLNVCTRVRAVAVLFVSIKDFIPVILNLKK